MRKIPIALSLGVSLSASFVWAQTKPPTPPLKTQLSELRNAVEALQGAAALSETTSQALADLEGRIIELEKGIRAVDDVNRASAEAALEIDLLKEEMSSLRREQELQRTSLADLEQPAAHGGSGGSYQGGMQIRSEDGRYSLRLGGFLQTRYQATFPEDFDSMDEGGFLIRRARLAMDGQLGSKRLSYQLSLDLENPDSPLRDFFMDMRYRDELVVRVGQGKLPYSRSFLVMSRDRILPELSQSQELQRYDRDIGVWAHGEFLDGRLRYIAGLSNGSGQNSPDTNIDLASSIRVQGAVLGELVEDTEGDSAHSEDARLSVGASFVHDLVRLPERVSGIEVGNRDVNRDAVLDNVRVMSSALDAQFRYQGFEFLLEGTWRHERWGAILDHADNADLDAAVAPSSTGKRNYLGITATASYFAIPKRLLVGTRLSHGRLPLLGVGGLAPAEAPLAQRALQLDAIVQLYRDGVRRVGFSYGLVNFNEKGAADPDLDKSHRFVLEAQLVF